MSDETTYSTYSTSGPAHLASDSELLASMEAYLSSVTRRAVQVTWAPQAPLRGEVRVEHLGPDGREFKIVRLPGGKRVLVDQAAEVEDPYRVRFWLHALYPLTSEPRHVMRAVCS